MWYNCESWRGVTPAEVERRIYSDHTALLTDREHHVLIMYYGLQGHEMSLAQVARDLNLTFQQVAYARDHALKRLRFLPTKE